MAGHLLWFDSAGAAAFGVATLADWLDRLVSGSVDPKAAVKVGPERSGTAVLDGRNGPGPLVLLRAAEIASEKARDVGVGIVRVKGIGPSGPATPAVAEAAVGPMIVSALGPGGSWTIAVPSAGGPPFLADSAFGGGSPAALPPLLACLEPGEWLVQAVAVAALEPLSSLHERVAERASTADGPSILRPDRLDEHRRIARERGVPVDPAARAAIAAWAGRLGVEGEISGV